MKTRTRNKGDRPSKAIHLLEHFKHHPAPCPFTFIARSALPSTTITDIITVNKLILMALQNNLNLLTTQLYQHKSPAEHFRFPQTYTQPLDHNLGTFSYNRQSQQVILPKAKNLTGDWEEDYQTTVNLMMMKEMVMGLLVHHSNGNKEVDALLNQLLSHLKIMLGCVPKKNSKLKRQVPSSQRLESDMWIEENVKLTMTLNRLREISKAKQTREALLAIQKIRDKMASETGISERNMEVRRSQVFKQKTLLVQRQSQRTQHELRELKSQMMVLRKEKVKLMMQLNREIDISNKKSQEIKALQGQLQRKCSKTNRVSPNKLDRCRSNPKDPNHLYQQLSLKQQQISQLINQNHSLKTQLKQLQEITFSESFLSDAFNVRDQQIAHSKEEYEKTIAHLQAHVFELQNQVDSARLSDYDDKRISFQQTAECKSSYKSDKDKSHELPSKALQHKINDLEKSLKKQGFLRASLEKQVEFLRDHEKSLNVEIVLLKNQVNRLKTISSFPSSPQLMRSTSSGSKFRCGR